MSGIQKGIKAFAICLALFIILSIFSVIFSIFDSFSYSKKESFQETYQNISDLEIDLGATNLVITKGSSFVVEGKDVSSRLRMEQKGSKLIIREKNFALFNSYKGEINITIPDQMLNSLEIDAKAGLVDIKNISARSLDVDQGAGLLKIENTTFNKADIDGGAGEIKIQDTSLNNLDLDAGVGKVSISGKILGQSKIDCGVGEVNLNLLGNIDDYYLLIDKGIGKISVDDKEYKNKAMIGNGINKIDIDGGVGAININFKN